MDLNKAVFVCDKVLSTDSLNHLQNFVYESTFPTTPSFVFDTQKSENIVDQNVRKSKTLHVKDPQLLSFVESHILVSIMEEFPELKITLARDYVTFIKYDVGGFFDWHVDFEKVTINGGKYTKEMHLLFCLRAPEEGGELLLKKDGETIIIPAPKTLNSVVIFDKLLEHRAEEVKVGQKIIMTVDVFANTVYSDLSTSDEQRFIDFASGKNNCFTIGSFEQFTKLYQQIDLYKPNHNWIPFLQIRVECNRNIYEVDYIENIGITRFEEINEKFKWEKYERSSWYESITLSRLNYMNVESDNENENNENDITVLPAILISNDIEHNDEEEHNNENEQNNEGDEGDEGDEEDEEEDEGDEEDGDEYNNDNTKKRNLVVETVDAQTQKELPLIKHKSGVEYETICKSKKYENFLSLTQPLFLNGSTVIDALDVICKFLENEHDQFHLQDTFKQIKNPPAFLKMKDNGIISLPESTYFENNYDHYGNDNVGFSYHCNESNYDTIDIKFRYGLVKFEESMLSPSKPSCLV